MNKQYNFEAIADYLEKKLNSPVTSTMKKRKRTLQLETIMIIAMLNWVYNI